MPALGRRLKSLPLPVFLPILLSRNLTVNGTDSKCAGIIRGDSQFDAVILAGGDPPDRVDVRLDVPTDDLLDDPPDAPLDDLLDALPTGTVSGICPDHPLAACAANGETIGLLVLLVLFLEGDIGTTRYEKKKA